MPLPLSTLGTHLTTWVMVLLCFRGLNGLAQVWSCYLFPFLEYFISFFSKRGGRGGLQDLIQIKGPRVPEFFFAHPLAWMAPSTVLPLNVIDYANRSTDTFTQIPTAKESIYISNLSAIIGSGKQVFI